MSVEESLESYPEWLKAICKELKDLGFSVTHFDDLSGNGLVFIKDSRRPNKKTLILTFQRQRLGNFIASLKNVVAISRKSRGSVEAFINFPFESEFLERRSQKIRGLKVLETVSEIDRYGKVIVHSNFFGAKGMSLKQISESRSITKSTSRLIGLDRNLASHKAKKRIEFLIHIRSGDIFKQSPHPGYAQPPLGFYQKAVNDANPKKVTLVFEDFGNPVTSELISFLHAKNVEIKIIGANLEAVVNSILSARTVVFGTGTFVSELLSLSRVIEKVYVLKKFGYANVNTWLRKVERVQFSCVSKDIESLLPWENNEFQRNLMLKMESDSFIRKD